MAELQIQGQGVLGIAFETTLGTYVAPTKWIPIRSESLQFVEDKKYRMNIRGTADRQAPGVLGPGHVEGDVEFEVTADTLVYFLYAARMIPARVGAAAPYTYTFTPYHGTKASTATGVTARKTLSALVARGGEGFGYTGLSVASLAFSFDDEVLICTASFLGKDEADQTIPTADYTGVGDPFGPDHNSFKIPAAGAVRTDISDASITIDDGAEVRARIDGDVTPSGIRWGEREVTVSLEHDFESQADYDAFRDNTQQDIEFTASRDAANDQIVVTIRGTISDSYESSLDSIGDLVAASVEYHGVHDAAGIYTIEVKTNEDVTA